MLVSPYNWGNRTLGGESADSALIGLQFPAYLIHFGTYLLLGLIYKELCFYNTSFRFLSHRYSITLTTEHKSAHPPMNT
jgi:hypothetical protein